MPTKGPCPSWGAGAERRRGAAELVPAGGRAGQEAESAAEGGKEKLVVEVLECFSNIFCQRTKNNFEQVRSSRGLGGSRL